jgi:hypothetical protein
MSASTYSTTEIVLGLHFAILKKGLRISRDLAHRSFYHNYRLLTFGEDGRLGKKARVL